MRKLRRVVSKTNGTGDGNRTRTTLRSQDFKSWASTNSATPARLKRLTPHRIGFKKAYAMILGGMGEDGF